MAGLSISRAWDETKAILAKDGRLLATVAAALFLLPQVLVGLATGQSSAQDSPGGVAVLLMTVAALVGLVGQLAVIRMASGGPTSVGGAIGHGLRRALIFIGSLLLVLAAVLIFTLVVVAILGAAGVVELDLAGQEPRPRDVLLIMVLLLIPFMVLAIRLLPIAAVISEEPVGPIAALKRAWALTSGHGWKLLGFVLVFLLGATILSLAVTIIGTVIVQVLLGDAEPFTLAALVMALFAAVAQALVTLVYIVMIARIYAQLAGPRTAEVEEVFR